ncbi:hypothetical protein GGR53DRAFT_325231 [Hypoxylon sp. FL1150]|nr:hypothetical protein GGR53DRAFT_325231 [Hypoxylon sp. FL1150]
MFILPFPSSTDPTSLNCRQVTQMDNAPAPLEAFPPEIKLAILCSLTLNQLNGLIRASPAFLQQYLADRRYVLISCLRNVLGSVFVDAVAVHRTRSADPNADEVLRILDNYRNMRAELVHTRELGEADATNMVKFYTKLVLPVTRKFISWAARHAGKKLGISSFCHPLSISRTEGTRFLRSLYRYHLCCQLFGHGRFAWMRRVRRAGNPDPTDILTRFFFLYEPWEVEEVYCVSQFVRAVYRRTYYDFEIAVKSGNVRIADEPVPPPIYRLPFPLNIIPKLDILAQSAGLIPLCSIFALDRDDHGGLLEVVASMTARIRPEARAWWSDIGWAHEKDPLKFFRVECKDGRFQAELKRIRDAGEPRPFEGDRAAGPPLAWTLMHGSVSSSLYCFLTPELLAWACVMWDAERLKETGAYDTLLKQWRTARSLYNVPLIDVSAFFPSV